MTDLELLIRDKYDGDASGVTQEDRHRLAKGEPLAYVIGWIPFLDVRVHLDSRPLIPRPETEWWTEKLITHITDSSIYGGVIDLCAGSGAIGLAILKHVPKVHVTFAEKDAVNLETIQKSIVENALDAERVRLTSGDLFENLQGEKFDLIACNPPYIPSARLLDSSVTNYEPTDALFSGEDGLELIRRISQSAKEYISEGGELWLEADIENIEEARNLLVSGGAHTASIHQDLYGRPRLVVAYY